MCLHLLTWGNPQGGATPLYTAAHSGHKELADILLQNGAEVNAACKVIYDEWTDVIQRNACEGGRNEGQIGGTTLAMADYIEPIVHG